MVYIHADALLRRLYMMGSLVTLSESSVKEGKRILEPSYGYSHILCFASAHHPAVRSRVGTKERNIRHREC
jgi:hypothetical protein